MENATSLLAGIRRRVSDWYDRHTQMQELDECDGRDLQRVLQDLNVTRFELAHAVRRGAYPKLLLPEMLQALGLDADRLKSKHPRIEADLNRVCAQCPETKRCRHELNNRTTRETYREFCYNSATFEALLAEAEPTAKTAG